MKRAGENDRFTVRNGLRADLMFCCACILALPLTAGHAEERKEVKLSGEYKARLEYSKPTAIAIAYGAQIREGSYLSVSANSEILLRASDDDPKAGSTKLQVTGMCDIFGSSKEPVTLRSLNTGKVVIGDADRRDDVKPKPTLTAFRMRCAVVVNTAFAIREGNVTIEECVFVNSPVWVDGGKQVVISKCTFVNQEGAGLEIVRSDKYPTISVRGCAFMESATGLAIKLGTMRPNRAPCIIADCNFQRNRTHVFFEDLVHFGLQSCWLSEPDYKDAAAFAYPSDAQYKGRLIPQSIKKSAISYAGASLVRDGLIKPLELVSPPATEVEQPPLAPKAPQPPAAGENKTP